MELRSHLPPPSLRPFVGAAYGYKVPANPAGVHRGLPSRHVTLVIELNQPLQVAGPSGRVAAYGVVGGLHTCPVIIDASQPQEGLQYGLSPLGCEALLGAPASALSGLVVDLAGVLGAPAARLIERVGATGDWHERFRLVDAALSTRMGDVAAADPALSQAWHLIFQTGGRLSVDGLARRVGYSRRHLSERLRTATGFTPKQAVRIARFETAQALLHQPHRPPLAHIAATCGYADQAHFARDWKQLAGCTVTTWLREELPFLQDDEAAGRQASGHDQR